MWCWLFHRKFREELLIEESVYEPYGCSYWHWRRFWHCNKCHKPLLDPEKTYRTPSEHETIVRQKMLERSIQ